MVVLQIEIASDRLFADKRALRPIKDGKATKRVSQNQTSHRKQQNSGLSGRYLFVTVIVDLVKAPRTDEPSIIHDKRIKDGSYMGQCTVHNPMRICRCKKIVHLAKNARDWPILHSPGRRDQIRMARKRQHIVREEDQPAIWGCKAIVRSANELLNPFWPSDRPPGRLAALKTGNLKLKWYFKICRLLEEIEL